MKQKPFKKKSLNQKSKDILKQVSQYWGTLCLIGAVVVLGISITLAAYTNFSVARRVVSVKDGSVILFSSNLLFTEDKLTESGAYRNRKLTLNDANGFLLDIANYIPGDASTFNNQNIVYSLQITLLSESSNPTGYSVKVGDQSYFFTESAEEGTYVLLLENQKLAGNVQSKNSYTVFVPEADKNQVRLCVEAIPEDNSYPATNYKKLAAGIIIGELLLEKNWTGKLLDNREGRLPVQYDGFNYAISGYGEGKLTLSWDTAVLDVNPWFEEDLTDLWTSTSEGKKTITFTVGGKDQPTAYQTQFYWVGEPQDISWEELLKYITLSFIETK